MVRQTETEALEAAWRALAGESGREGWKTIPIAVMTQCRVLAGRHFPGNKEAVLLGFPSTSVRSCGSLPAGNGFAVRPVDLGAASEGCTWFGLVRQPQGRLDFFTMMATDVVSTLAFTVAETGSGILVRFLERVRAWQSFMERDKGGVLSTEAEIGLYGELVILLSILQAGVRLDMAVDCWCGPLDGLQDFQFPTGVIEVKATASTGTFPASVTSLEQLDCSLVRALFLAGVKFRLDPSGATLPEKVAEIRSFLREDRSALAAFDTRLLHAGFFPALSEHYNRTFIHESTKIFRVSEDFPKITHGTVHRAIRKARYEIDLNLVDSANEDLVSVLPLIGAI